MDYESKRWKRKRRYILRLDGYRDRVAARYGKVREANTVHHIYPVDEYPQYAWEDWNLISVADTTHNAMHNRQTGELIGDGLTLKQRTKPDDIWSMKSSSKHSFLIHM